MEGQRTVELRAKSRRENSLGERVRSNAPDDAIMLERSAVRFKQSRGSEAVVGSAQASLAGMVDYVIRLDDVLARYLKSGELTSFTLFDLRQSLEYEITSVSADEIPAGETRLRLSCRSVTVK